MRKLTFGNRWFRINLDEPARALAAADAPSAADEEFPPLKYDGDTLSDRDEILSRMDQSAVLPTGLSYTVDTLAVKQRSDPKNASAEFVIVTRGSAPNRHGNLVEILPNEYGQGMRLDEYASNPVVLLDHGLGFPLPIGRSANGGKLTVTAQKTKITATAFFSQRIPEAVAVFALIDEGMLNAASVGYQVELARMLRPDPPKRNADPDTLNMASMFGGMHFVQTSLMEWSVVAVGADASALRKVQDRGHVAGQKLTPVMRQWLAAATPEKPVWAPGVSFPALPVAKPVEQKIEPVKAAGIDAPVLPTQNPPQIDLRLVAQRLAERTPQPKPLVSAELAAQVVTVIDQQVGGLARRVDALSGRLCVAQGG